MRALLDTGPLEPREIGLLCRISSPSLAGVLARMAPQIEATYREIETLIGAEFSSRFYRALDELIGALAAHEPAAVANE